MFEVLGVKIGLNILVQVYGSYQELYYSDWHYRKLEKKSNSIIDTICKGYVSHLVVA